MRILVSQRSVGLSVLAIVLLPGVLLAQFAGNPTTSVHSGSKQAKPKAARPNGPSDGPKTVDPAAFIPGPLAANATIEFTDAPLREIADWISKQQGMPVLVDKTGLSEEGLSAGEPVTDHLREEPIYLLLDRLRSLGLAWYVRDDILHITTVLVAEEHLSTKSYNVSDLFDSGYSPEVLIDTIQQATYGPWADVDGIGGRGLTCMGDVLFVRTTPSTHREVAGLLTALRTHGRETFVLDPAQHIVLRDKLDQQVSVRFSDTPLLTAIQELAQRTQCNMRLDTLALQEAGIPERGPVSLTLSDRKLSTVLHVLLSDLGLTWTLRDGVLWITTNLVAQEVLKTVVYDVQDLCTTTQEAFELAVLIRDQTKGPWLDVDRTGGTFSFPVPQTMIVQQTEHSLREVRELLAVCRKALATSKPRKKETVDPQTVETRYYRMDAEMAADLLNVLPQLVQPGTWQSDTTPQATGRILKASSGSDVLEAKGPIVSAAANSAGGTESSSGRVIVPKAVLIIRHTRAVHEEVAKIIIRVEQGDPPVLQDGDGMDAFGGGIGIGGEF